MVKWTRIKVNQTAFREKGCVEMIEDFARFLLAFKVRSRYLAKSIFDRFSYLGDCAFLYNRRQH